MLGIFIVDKALFIKASLFLFPVFAITLGITRVMSLSNRKTKYVLLFGIVAFSTILNVFLTYHAILTSILPLVFATLYSSKKFMYYVYGLSVVSSIIVVVCGYYFGLCDANMALLTVGTLQSHTEAGQFALSTINNDVFSLVFFYAMPRSLIYIAIMFVCNSIGRILSSGLRKAKMSEELAIAKEKAENANRAKTKFLARMSHEIRTPINAVIGMNELIIRESKEPNIKQYSQDVKNSSMILLSLINEILDSSKIESGMMEIVPVRYEMGSLLNDLYNMVSYRAKEKKLELIFDIDPNIPCKYLGDNKRIRQVILNVLTNAIKYTNEGKVMLKVYCSNIIGDMAVLHIAVKDTGIGIKKEDISRIYDEFSRFDADKNANEEGSGLGMSIAQQFLKLMGSELKIDSEYGHGSEFSFDIQQKIEDTQPLGNFRERYLIIEAQSDTQFKFVAPMAKILVVDDNKMNLKVFRNLVKDSKMQIVEAESGTECLRILEDDDRFDILLIDHMMPGMDGIETLNAIKEKNYCEGKPLVMFTANAIIGDRENFLKQGFDDVLTKPVMPNELNRMLLKYLPKDYIELVDDDFEKTEINVLESQSEEDKNEEQPTETEEKEVANAQQVEEKKVEKIQLADSKKSPEEILDILKENLPEMDFKAGLMTCGNDTGFYLDLLNDFVNLSIKQVLNDCIEETDYRNYCISVHGLKNNAYSLGAKDIGDLAYEMEKATRDSLPERIDDMQVQLFEQYDRVCKGFWKALKD